MKKMVAVLLFSLLAGVTYSQSQVFDYLVIRLDAQEVIVFGSTIPEIRKVEVPTAKGRYIAIELSKAAIKIVQEYEAEGWVLFNVPGDALHPPAGSPPRDPAAYAIFFSTDVAGEGNDLVGGASS